MIKKIYFFLFFISLLNLSCSAKNTILIIDVHDGDTFKDNKNNKYRIFGIDAPEMSNQFKDFKQTKGLERIYDFESTMFARKTILNKNIKIEYKYKDKYKRIVCKVFFNKKDLGCELIKNGFALVSYISLEEKSIYKTKDFNYYKKILLLQRKAQINKKRFWKHEEYLKTIFPKQKIYDKMLLIK